MWAFDRSLDLLALCHYLLQMQEALSASSIDSDSTNDHRKQKQLER